MNHNPLRLLEIKIRLESPQRYIYTFEKGYVVTFTLFFGKIENRLLYKEPETLFHRMGEISSIIKTGEEKEVRRLACEYVDFFYRKDLFINEINEKEDLKDWIEFNADKINWSWLSLSERVLELNLDFIESFLEEWDWDNISKLKNITGNFIERFSERINWNELSSNPKLTWKIIDKYKEKVDWASLANCRKISENKIIKYCNLFNEDEWASISINKLSNDFIRNYHDKLEWSEISFFQKLDENIISDFKHKIYWADFMDNQFLDNSFKEEMYKKYNDNQGR